jgi:signal peptidase I
VPKQGVTVPLTLRTLPLYSRIIDVFEENDLKVENGKIFINGKEATEYTFKMDYYWMMGDNRHNSADSRYWGFVPMDHVVGEAVFVWLSLDPNKTLLDGKIRFNKLFRVVK